MNARELAALRAELGLLQKDFADELGMTRWTYNRYERRGPNQSVGGKSARLLHLAGRACQARLHVEPTDEQKAAALEALARRLYRAGFMGDGPAWDELGSGQQSHYRRMVAQLLKPEWRNVGTLLSASLPKL